MPKTDRTIPPPSGDKEPLKTNVYQFIQNSVTALAPLFPYYDEGSIVPCVATFRGGPGKNYGRFQHFNTVDEVVILFGAQGGRGRLALFGSGRSCIRSARRSRIPATRTAFA